MGHDVNLNPFSRDFYSWDTVLTLYTGGGWWLTGRLFDYAVGLLQPDVPKALEQGQAYSLQNKQNSVRLGASKPVLYGKFRIYPNTGSQAWTEYIDNVQYVNVLLDVTLGKAQELQLLLGDTPLENFAGVQSQTYAPGETVAMFHNNVYTNPDVNDLEMVTIGTTMGPAQLTFSADDHTVTAPTGIFTKVEADDRVAITGSQFNDGVVKVAEISGDLKTLTISGVLVDETPPRTPPTLATITRASDGMIYGPARFNFDADTQRITAVDAVTDGVDLSTLAPGEQITIAGSVLNDQTTTVLSADTGGTFVAVTSDLTEEEAEDPPNSETTITLVSQDVGPFFANKAGTNISQFSVDISHPKGLYSVNDKGKLRDSTSTHRVEWRKEGDTDYTLAADESFTARLNTPQRFTRTYEVPPTVTGRIEVKVTRTNETAADSREMNESHWVGLRGFVLPPTGTPDPDGPIYDVGDTGHYAYPDMTKLAIRAKVTGQIVSGMAQRFNGWFQRLIDVWDGEHWIADQPSSSIAWIYADAIHNSDYGLGRARSEIDVETLAALDALWTARGDAFNFYFDNGGTWWEAAGKILRCGRAEPLYDGRSFSAVRDEPRALRTALFSDQSVLKGSFNLQFSLPDEDTAQGVRVTYWDAETGEQKQVMCGDDVNTLEVSLDGCTSRQQAFNEGWFQLNQIKYRRSSVKFGTEMAGFVPMRGEFATVQAEIIQWGQSARVLERQGRALRLDQRLDWSVGTEFRAFLRDEEGSPTASLGCSRGIADDWLVLAADPPIDVFTIDDDQEPTHVTLGVPDYEPTDIIIQGTEDDDEYHTTINAVIEDARVHADPGTAPAE